MPLPPCVQPTAYDMLRPTLDLLPRRRCLILKPRGIAVLMLDPYTDRDELDVACRLYAELGRGLLALA